MANEKRLIDANALVDDTYVLNSWDAEIVRAWVADQPTVDAVEVVHGRWVIREFPLSNTKKMSCSCCDYSENKGPAWDKSWGVPNYCPNCGASMKDGDGND